MRLLAAVGLPVTRLVRVRIGPVRLGRLAPGEVRELTHDVLERFELPRMLGLRRLDDDAASENTPVAHGVQLFYRA